MKSPESALLTIGLVGLLLAIGLSSADAQGFQNSQLRRPPALFDENQDKAVPIGLAALNVKVNVVGQVARTSLTMRFFNKDNRARAGNLYVPLPPLATVSGYALDIQGAMVDGVPVERDTGRQIYQTVLARGIDPGIVEWTKGNIFKTRVFPIPANGSRTVRLDYVQPLDIDANGLIYSLPLDFGQSVPEFSLEAFVDEGVQKPLVTLGGLGALDVTTWQKGFRTQIDRQNLQLSGQLILRLPSAEANPVAVEKGRDGQTYVSWFGTRSKLAEGLAVPKAAAKSRQLVHLYWDASASQASTNTKTLLETLRVWAQSTGNKGSIDVNLTVFRDRAESTKRFTLIQGDATALIVYLAQVPNDGSTRLRDLPKPETGTDYAILVSDGLVTQGQPDFNPGLPVWVLTASSRYDAAKLSAIATSSGGAVIAVQNPATDGLTIGVPAFRFLGATIRAGQVRSIIPVAGTTGTGGSSGLMGITGILATSQAAVDLRFGYGQGQEKTISVVWRQDPEANGDGTLLATLWAQSQMAELAARLDAETPAIKDQLRSLGQTYGLAGPGTSLIVLESLQQYIEFAVQPPASLPDLRTAWAKAMGDKKKAVNDQKEGALAAMVKLWESRVAWWNKEFKYPSNFKWTELQKGEHEPPRPTASLREAEAPQDLLNADQQPAREAATSGAAKQDGKNRDGEKNEPTVTIQAWRPDTPWLRELDAISGRKDGAKLTVDQAAKAYARYLTLRSEFRSSPGFYLDVGDWFEQGGESNLAARVWSNLAEIDLESPSLLRIWAYRLVQNNNLPTAKEIFEQVLDLRREEPQSYRDLALTLDKMGQSGQAIDLLYQVVTGTWSQWSEIGLTALTELNAMIPRAQKAKQTYTTIDKRLIKLLDTDVRIVLTWDANLSDMDLWVIEPSGEKAFYGKHLSTIGGLVSQDITAGYGPEEYLIHRAMNGEYTVKVNYYGNRNPEVSGTVTLQAEVITNFGRSNEKRQMLTLQLKGSSDTYQVGTIKF